MPTLTAPIVVSVVATVLTQFLAMALIPATRGFTAPVPTIVCVTSFVASLGIAARMVHNGIELSALAPVIMVATQVLILAVGMLVYGESASSLKIALVVVAAVMIGASTRL